MPTLAAPVIVNDATGAAGTAIGRLQGVPLITAGTIEAIDLHLYSFNGIDTTERRATVSGGLGMISLETGDGGGVNIMAKNGISIMSARHTAFFVDANGNLSLADTSGTPRMVVDAEAGILRILNPVGQNGVQVDSTGRINLTDVLGSNSISFDAPNGQIAINQGNGLTGIELDGLRGLVKIADGAGTEIRFDAAGGSVFPGNVTVNGDVFLPGADCAEEFDVAGSAPPEAGTVLVIGKDGVLHESRAAYDRKVAGVVSGAGEHRPGILLDRRDSTKDRAPVALAGKVLCKVDATRSPIAIGDLLTTSASPGHAMRANDRARAFGAVIGKALKPLRKGRGLIPILVALQ